MTLTSKLVDAWRNPPTTRDLQHMTVAENLAVGMVYVMTPLLLPLALAGDIYSAVVR